MLGRYVGKWFYAKGITFDAANGPYFPLMVNAIQKARPRIVEEVGDKHVVQFITDNARACVSAGSKLIDKRKHLVWTPCAAHIIDLMLEEIGEIKIVKETLQEARLVSRFIYNHSKILFLFREQSKIRPAITHFATDYLVVNSIRESEGAIKRLFTNEEWLMTASRNPVPG
ncbi:hypothetical protein AMTR_s00049p00200660 [Amborella trichopoda]|uniref:DUF659 domain-containing protein n=1 Tax=Amborella trichopoda TaxID=13333 RepID=W1PZH3_AMBTC|nr:hypothetical protein AMTR_s00049p00200660 [Amborella trichopoda]